MQISNILITAFCPFHFAAGTVVAESAILNDFIFLNTAKRPLTVKGKSSERLDIL